ncbi:hypothetical protein [Nitratireductor sp. OM-1]|nr:hypothetical protein [Nitratireductor sp. OM-1]
MKAALVATLVALAAPSYAQSSNYEAMDCDAIGDLAKGIMLGRQTGLPLGKAMELVRDSDIEAVTRMAEDMVIMAYDSPRYNSTSGQERAVEEFRNIFELACYKANR